MTRKTKESRQLKWYRLESSSQHCSAGRNYMKVCAEIYLRVGVGAHGGVSHVDVGAGEVPQLGELLGLPTAQASQQIATNTRGNQPPCTKENNVSATSWPVACSDRGTASGRTGLRKRSPFLIHSSPLCPCSPSPRHQTSRQHEQPAPGPL